MHRPSWSVIALAAAVVAAAAGSAACTAADPAGAPDPSPPADAGPSTLDAAPAPPPPSPPPAPDAAPPAPDAAVPTIWDRCFPGRDPSRPLPAYDGTGALFAASCAGTNHQDIAGIEKVAFIGDSITEGTPPTAPWQYYRARLTQQLIAKFGWIETVECARWGARTDDLLLDPHKDILQCFPGPEPKRTLVVLTIGGNDLHAIAKAAQEGASLEEQLAMADEAIALFRDAIAWFRADPARFPKGVYVVFANVYEFTDGESDLDACGGAGFVGMGTWPEMRAVYRHVNEAYARIAAETGTDMIFLNEHFCGHGFHAGEAANECYRGPGAKVWFDFTCTHPNADGHAAIADLFLQVVDE